MFIHKNIMGHVKYFYKCEFLRRGNFKLRVLYGKTLI